VYDQGAWQTPLGEVPVDGELAVALLKAVPALRADRGAHAREHSIEVQLPLMQVLSPGVRILPINVSPSKQADRIGREIGEALKGDFATVSAVGSTDLTHYGPSYGFTPAGLGAAGLEWAAENDERVLRAIEQMEADAVIEEAATHHNACGGGAIAATISACSALGATRGVRLEYTTSAEVMKAVYSSRADDCVGYASVIFA
jgi:AmmeMemoRadiSam system protein B